MDDEKKEYLKSIYYNISHPGSYAGVQTLYEQVLREGKYRISKQQVSKFLKGEEVYFTHVDKHKAKHFQRTTIPAPNTFFQSDVAVMKFGKKFKYYVIVVDGFSRKAKARVVANLKNETFAPVLVKLIQELGGTVNLSSDFGREFVGHFTQEKLKEIGVNWFPMRSKSKAYFSERLIRFISSKLYKIMQSKGTAEWYKFLPEVVESYNKKPHRSLEGFTPNEAARKENTPFFWYLFHNERLKHMPRDVKFKFELNDAVKLYVYEKFRKGYLEKGSPVVYFVASRKKKDGVPVYKLKNGKNELLEGGYSESILQKVKVDKDTVYRIEKIIKYVNKKGVRHALVRWQGYTQADDTLVPLDQIKDLDKPDV